MSRQSCKNCFKRLLYPKCSLNAVFWDKEYPDYLPPVCSSWQLNANSKEKKAENKIKLRNKGVV